MQVVRKDDVSIYNLTRGKQLPSWLSDRKRRKLQQEDTEIQQRIELIQDFDMPTASSCVTLSRSGDYIIAAGTYKPRIRCFEADQLSMKFERHLNAEVVAMQCLSEDYSKIVMALADRTIEVHARYGFHYRTRVPKHCRAMAYHFPSCDLVVAGSSAELWRLNLDQGRFLAPYAVENGSAVNALKINPMHGLICAGTDAGFVECFDPRSRERAGALDVARWIPADLRDSRGGVPEVTAIECFANGLTMGVGTSSGHVLLFDLRSSRPHLTKDHYNGLRIHTVTHHPASENIISADAKGIKIWNEHTGDNYTSVEAAADLNQVCVVPGSGLMFAANESSDIFTYFIPSLAPAPKWCSYLDSITEELEENAEAAVYDDYKFVTRDEVDKLGITGLIGTPMLRAYMHGFFMDAKLYREAKTLSEPFAYEEYRKERLEKILEEGEAKRITLRKAARALPKVNRRLAERMLEQGVDGGASGGKRKKKKTDKGLDDGVSGEAAKDTDGPKSLVDSRFGALFTDAAFEVDEASEQYRLLHPSESAQSYASNPDLLVSSDRFNPVESSEESEVEGRGSDGESSSDDDAAYKRGPRKPVPERKKKKKKPAKADKEVSMLELNEGESFKPGMSRRDVVGEVAPTHAKKSFASRLKAEVRAGPKARIRNAAGGKEMTFSQRPAKTAVTTDGDGDAQRTERRGVGGLGLKKAPKQKYWRGKPV